MLHCLFALLSLTGCYYALMLSLCRMYSSVHIWSSSRLVAQGFLDDMADGIHTGELAMDWDSQILYNMYCNRQLRLHDASCCMSADQATLLQVVVLAILATRFFLKLNDLILSYIHVILFIY